MLEYTKKEERIKGRELSWKEHKKVFNENKEEIIEKVREEGKKRGLPEELIEKQIAVLEERL